MKPIPTIVACLLAALIALSVPLAAQEPAAADAPAFRAGTDLPENKPGARMSIAQAALLGIVEGVTEYLPVSSTGHLTVVQRLMGLWSTAEEKAASDAYAICIQAGAIIAVLWISFGRIRSMARGIVGRDREGLRLLANLAIAAIPAGLIGFLLEGRIKERLYGLWPVTAAWCVGGLFILAILVPRQKRDGAGIEGLTWKTALVIGLAQIIALWPGISRSLVTMAAGIFLGLSVSAAVEFSFLLGLVTLGAATLYEGIKLGPAIIGTFGWVSPVIGVIVAAVAAFVAVKWMVGYLRTRSMAIFGWYRIGIAAVTAALIAARVI